MKLTKKMIETLRQIRAFNRCHLASDEVHTGSAKALHRRGLVRGEYEIDTQAPGRPLYVNWICTDEGRRVVDEMPKKSTLKCSRHGFLDWEYVTTIKSCGLCMEEDGTAATFATPLQRC